MIVVAAVILILVLACIPVLAAPSWFVAVLAALTTIACASGIIRRSTFLVAGGGSLALAAYALALSLSGTVPALLPPAAFGVALALLLQIAGFRERFRGATLGPAVVAAEMRYLLGVGVGSLGVAILLAGLAAPLSPVLPRQLRPVIAAAGALGALVGAARTSTRGLSHEDSSGPGASHENPADL